MATTPANIAKVRQAINDVIQAGDPQTPLFYGKLEEMTGVDKHTEAHGVLEELSTAHYAEHGLLISTVVVAKETGFPGKGYFTLAQELGLFPKTESIGGYLDGTFFPSSKAADFWRFQQAEIFRLKPKV